MPRFLLIAALLLGACGPRGTTPAGDALQAYVQALQSEDPKPLYQMLSKERRAKISYEAWAAQWPKDKAERMQQAQQIETAWQGQLATEAEVVYEDGQALTLEHTPYGWRLDQALAAPSIASSPKTVLRQLLHALEARDFALLLSLLSEERRQSIEERLANFEQGLVLQEALEDSEVYQSSERRAELNWSHQDVRYRLVFVREGADWRLHEIQMGPDATTPKEPPEIEDCANSPDPLCGL